LGDVESGDFVVAPVLNVMDDVGRFDVCFSVEAVEIFDREFAEACGREESGGEARGVKVI
jgi:hypothetical protein